MPKSPLKYFVRLIKLEDLVERRNAFHLGYSILARCDREVAYYAESEYAEMVKETDDFKFISTGVDFRKTLRREVASALKSAKFSIYKRLTSGLFAEQGTFYQQVMRDVEELTGIVDEQLLYTNYPYIAEALRDIRKFAIAHQPSLLGRESAAKPVPPKSGVERVVGFHYRYFEKGTSKEDKPLARHLLGVLYTELKDKLELIAPDTSVDEFRAVFLGKNVTKPIKWLGINSQLYRFIQAISPKLIPPGQRKLDGKWTTTVACFVNRNGKAFEEKPLRNPGTSAAKVHKSLEIGELAKILR